MNFFYANTRSAGSKMPDTWQAWLLRIATFVAITASLWQVFVQDIYNMLYFTEYGTLFSAVGNTQVVVAIVGLIVGAIVYALYTAYCRFAYTALQRQLFFCDKPLTMWQYRRVADVAMIGVCVAKTALSLIWYFEPLYSTLLSSIFDPLVTAAIMGCALLYFIRYAGKGNALFVTTALAVWYCMPALFA